DAGELARDVEGGRGLRVAAGLLDEERLEPVACTRRHEDPIRAVAIHHHRLHAVELVTGAPSARTHADAFEGVSVTGLVDRDRAPRARGKALEERVQPERARRERRGDRGGEVRAGEDRATHLLLHDDGIDQTEPEAALLLRHEETGPSEVDDASPQVRSDP